MCVWAWWDFTWCSLQMFTNVKLKRYTLFILHQYIHCSCHIFNSFIADRSISMLSLYMMKIQVSCVLLLMAYAFLSGIHKTHVCSKRSFSSHSSQQMRVVSCCVFSFWTALILQQASSVRLELFAPIKGSSWPVNIKFACCFVLVRLDMSVMDGCCMEAQCRALKGFCSWPWFNAISSTNEKHSGNGQFWPWLLLQKVD